MARLPPGAARPGPRLGGVHPGSRVASVRANAWADAWADVAVLAGGPPGVRHLPDLPGSATLLTHLAPGGVRELRTLDRRGGLSARGDVSYSSARRSCCQNYPY